MIFAVPDREDNTSQSGYPLEVRYWDRSGAVAEAKTLYQAAPDHMSVFSGSLEVEEGDHRIVVIDNKDFFHKEVFLAEGSTAEFTKLPLPENFDWLSCKDGVLLFTPNEDYELHGENARGGIVAFDLSGYLETGEVAERLIFAAPERGAIEGIRYSEGTLYVNYLENVTSRVACADFERSECGTDTGPLTFAEIALPGLGDLSFGAQKNKDGFYVWYNDFTTPNTLYFIPTGAKELGEPVFQYPLKFDPAGVSVSQEWAKSADGTEIPFFVIDGRKDKESAGPTILNAYGGFGVSMNPGYSWVRGACWLERGGVSVVANIRGGGEFGPQWHEQGKFGGREKVYEDLIAVGERLVELGITTPEQLGVSGGSNGGLLTGNMLVRRPDLFNAVKIGVPLLDMLRYDKLLAGNSWAAEYGSPKKAGDVPALRAMSAYHNVDPTQDYPATLVTTSRTDDRVAPGHARKMTALLHEFGNQGVYFHENTDKGHNSSDFNNWIPDTAMTFNFFWQELS